MMQSSNGAVIGQKIYCSSENTSKCLHGLWTTKQMKPAGPAPKNLEISKHKGTDDNSAELNLVDIHLRAYSSSIDYKTVWPGQRPV